ncbi:hypothetical protein [Pseudomonas sp. GV085]|uniref:hypothetical protein n=1 Tax=Pseudomonas sp. GV085 TaxID=2135756 RepID=UPI000D3AE86C
MQRSAVSGPASGESRNQGACKFVDDYLCEILPQNAVLRYTGPPPGASTPPGNMTVHVEQQRLLVESAFSIKPRPPHDAPWVSRVRFKHELL